MGAKETEGGTWVNVNSTEEKGHVNIYDNNPQEPHNSIHINIDYEKETFNITEKEDGEVTKTDGKCAITNACIAYQLDSFDDNCYELTTLRWFRDNFLTKKDIIHYYHTSPLIVAAIMKLPNNYDIFRSIYINMLLPSITAIEKNEYQKAYDIYKNNMAELERKYINYEQTQRLIRIPQNNPNSIQSRV